MSIEDLSVVLLVYVDETCGTCSPMLLLGNTFAILVVVPLAEMDVDAGSRYPIGGSSAQ